MNPKIETLKEKDIVKWTWSDGEIALAGGTGIVSRTMQSCLVLVQITCYEFTVWDLSMLNGLNVSFTVLLNYSNDYYLEPLLKHKQNQKTLSIRDL